MMLPKNRRGSTFRDYLASKIGADGQKVWDVLIEIAEGKAWYPKLVHPVTHEEMIGPPQIPTSGDRARAAEDIIQHMFGKPVPETDIAKADGVTQERAALEALSDEELDRRVHAIYAAREARKAIASETVAVLAEMNEQEEKEPA